MATLEETQIPPVAPVTQTVATAPITQTIAPTAPATGIPLLTTIKPSDVYSPINVQEVLSGSNKSLQNMKLSKLEKKLASGEAQAETNQANIMNQTKAMGVLTGEAAHQSRLDTARLNAVTGMYNAKLLDKQRKDAERSAFMTAYGADPSKRPKGMSKEEFAKALAGGKFSNLIPQAFKDAQEKSQLEMAVLRRQAAGTSESTGTWSESVDENGNPAMRNSKTNELRPMGSVTATEQSPEMKAIETELMTSAGEDKKVDPQKYLEMRNSFAKQGLEGGNAQTVSDAFDKSFSHLLSPEGSSYIQQRGGITVTPQATTGGSKAAQIAQSIMTPGSTLKLSGLSVKMQASVQQELNKLKEEALANGDIYGIIRASAGGKDVDASFLQSFEKGVNVLSQIDELSKTIEDEATGPILGIIRSNNPYDTKSQEIKAMLTAIVPNLARGIYGEVGVLTDNDIALYSKTLPTISSTEDVRNAVLGLTMRSVQRSLENKIKVQAGAGRNVSGMEGIYRGIEETASNIENKLPKPQEQANISPEKQQYLQGIGLSNNQIEQKSNGAISWFNSLFK